MDQPQAGQWLVRIFATQELEIDCPTSFESLAQFVDLQLHGHDAIKLLPRVWVHLQHCAECRDVYDCLLALAELEDSETLPPPDFNLLFND